MTMYRVEYRCKDQAKWAYSFGWTSSFLYALEEYDSNAKCYEWLEFRLVRGKDEFTLSVVILQDGVR